MQEYNKKSAIIFNTLQFYRWDRLRYLLNLIDHARTEGFKLGLKNVLVHAWKRKDHEQVLGATVRPFKMIKNLQIVIMI